jgi:hypothetical protein
MITANSFMKREFGKLIEAYAALGPPRPRHVWRIRPRSRH